MKHKVFFFFTKLNLVYKKQLRAKGFFNEERKEKKNGKFRTESLGFNYSADSRIAQLYYSDKGVTYTYISDLEDLVWDDCPLVILVCDNTYHTSSDPLLDSLFRALLNHPIYCYFHQSNKSIEIDILKSFGSEICQSKSFMHEEGHPFFELISLLNVDSRKAFKENLEKLQETYLKNDQEIEKEKDLKIRLRLLHKILGQNYSLEPKDIKQIKILLNNTTLEIEENLEGIKKLRDHLLKEVN